MVQADKGKLKLQRADGEIGVTSRQVLWLTTDLEKYFQRRRR